ncbi:brassinosteroid-responsive RING protein 1-like [Lotus japonicus]|uniref:brassinosteroid-responsive RING protein 1-like n=1 Tax=Lotus japonicus TaxID=34305 RepID=UPI0025825E5A|nr:brassinosteroid-responsive RING protein 1-like [Lotus japonicus]
MGFPVSYTELVLPKLVVQLISMLGFIRKLVTILFCYLGLDPDIAWPERMPEFQSVSALLVEEILPVTKFSELQQKVDSSSPPPESCAVCLYDFEGEDEIRSLMNCRHIFHRSCLDRWIMGYDHRTCPLCRTPFIPHHIQQDYGFNDTVWAASGIPDSYSY